MSLDDVARRAGVGPECIRIIAKWEGCLKRVAPNRYAPYLCPARVPTIGYGTTVYNQTGRKVSMSDPAITREKAEELLAYDIGKVYAPAVNRAFNKWQHENQQWACVSFAYNCGTYAFARSTMCWLLKQGQYARAAEEFMKWTRGGGRVLPGLVNRRRDERRLFLTVPTGRPTTQPPAPAPSPTPQTEGRMGVFRSWLKWLTGK